MITKPVIGEKFNRCVILVDLGVINNRRMVSCQCDCGKIFSTRFYFIKTGASRSCGCYRTEMKKPYFNRFGRPKLQNRRDESGNIKKTYRAWALMKDRCLNHKSKKYNHYGGRGITICKEWIESYDVFYTDMGEPSNKNLTLERINNNLGYNKDNCKWATWKEQQNNRRNNLKNR